MNIKIWPLGASTTQKKKSRKLEALGFQKKNQFQIQSVSKSHKDEAIEGNKIAIPTKDSSNNESTPSGG